MNRNRGRDNSTEVFDHCCLKCHIYFQPVGMMMMYRIGERFQSLVGLQEKIEWSGVVHPYCFQDRLPLLQTLLWPKNRKYSELQRHQWQTGRSPILKKIFNGCHLKIHTHRICITNNNRGNCRFNPLFRLLNA
jgi:hypothetical protein